MKSLRLILFTGCNRNCAGCCNKDWDIAGLPVCTSFAGYDEILLTGGEPMLYPELVAETIQRIWLEDNDGDGFANIYVYTAKTDRPIELLGILYLSDGITVTLHEQSDVSNFQRFNELITPELRTGRSLRLNVFAGIDISSLAENGGLDDWTVKTDMVWIKDCPLPVNETLMKL